MTSAKTLIRRNITVLADDVQVIAYEWAMWKSLFREPDATVRETRRQLMRSYPPVEPFFALVEIALINKVILGLSRLLDSDRKTASLPTLVRHKSVLDPTAQRLVERLLRVATRTHTRAAKLRNNFLAHRNLDFATNPKAALEVSVRLSDIDETFQYVTEIIDTYAFGLDLAKIDWHEWEDAALPVEIMLEDARSFRSLPLADRQRLATAE